MLAARKRLTGVFALAVVASGLALLPLAPAAQANPAGTGLVINEVYGAGGNSGAVLNADFIELYNPSAAPISLNGLYLHYRSGSGSYGGITPLPTGDSVPSHSTYLIQASNTGANGSALPAVDYVANPALSLAAAGGQTILTTSSTNLAVSGDVAGADGIIDMVGVTGATTFEGAAATVVATTAKSVSRASGGVDSNSNSADFTQTDPTPTKSTSGPAPLGASTVADKTATVDVPITEFDLAATGGTAPYTWAATGLPAGVTLATDGTVSGTPTTVGEYDVTATVTDADAASDDVTFGFDVVAKDVKTIAEVQGTGARSPFAPATGNAAGDTVTVQGVVTGMYADPYPAELGANGGFDGMYIQTPGADTDGASDAIFVYGANSMPAGVAIGDSVEVTGAVSDYAAATDTFSLTEITPVAGGVTELGTSLGTVTPRAIAYPTTDAGREVREGELIAPTDELTVSNSYSTNQYGEIGLATGDHPLVQPTEVVRDDDTAGLADVKADNAARAVVLDDGTAINYLTNNSPQQDLPLPWLTATNAVRVGASVTLNQPVILDYRNNLWKFLPSTPVLDDGADVATFEDTRTPNLAPQPVGGDLKLATFNVLNFFNTTGQQYVLNGAAQSPAVNTACSFYNDRDGNPIGNNTCGVVTNGTNAGNGPRGAATQASLNRQRDKIVHAINTMGADIMSLEEIENSMKLVGETNRDDALGYLVAALNADAGAGTWKFVHSPAEALVSTAVSEQDVIRPAFIYKPAKVQPVGISDILFGTTEFANAREPLAQAFKPTGALDSQAFGVIVNHFKSKGDSTPPATGDNANSTDTGAFNGDRTRQATRLAQFADDFAAARNLDAIFLTGDFNSYTEEDPMHVLYDAGFTAIESPGEESYSFGGLSGSLDHVLGNAAAMAMVTGQDVWDINAAESVGYQYSRYNYNVTQLFDASNPFAASDHNPEIVGINVPDYGTDYTPIQIIGTNDFHGRLLADGANAAGSAILSGAVKELRQDNPNTVFAAAGDLIGASTFESFIQQDKPTIDALNEAGLEVSAAGNHEFDAGYEDLVGRVQDRADWTYIAANVEEPEGRDDLAETWTKTFGDYKVGFVGAVTEDLPSLVAPAGIAGVTVTDIVDATNAAAADLKADGADLVVLLVHEGAPSTDCATMTDPSTAWGHIVTGVDDDVDAIVSGHTHLSYNCLFPVTGWADRDVKNRPVVSAGQYGTYLNQLVFTFDNATGKLATTSQDVLGLVGTGYPVDQATKAIVDDAVAQADTLGAAVLGQIDGGFNRAKLSNGTTENRGGESTLGNLVAEVQRWATETPEAGSADIAFMNPGGLRADMVGTGSAAFPRDLTYKQAAVVQPFANTLINMNLTGANIKLALEQQWQRDASNNIPSRPFLRLGISDGFKYTYDPTKAEGSRITGMWLDGVAIDPTATYSVTVNSFLASGGDNFRAFNNGTGKRDTGKIDLQAMVDYMDEFASDAALPVDYAQRSVGVAFPGDAPAAYAPGGHVLFNVSSWSMAAPADVKDTAVQVKLGDDVIGSATLDNTVSDAVFDEVGKASVDVVLPEDVTDGPVTLTLVGAQTGTQVPVRITVEDGLEEIQVLATNDFHGRIQNDAASASAGAAVLSGAVKQLREANPNTVFAAAGDLIGASTFESFIQNDKPTIDALNEAGLEVSAVGNHELDKGYDDLMDRVLAAESETNPYGGAEWKYIAANLKMKETGDPAVPATFMKEMSGVQVGFVGAVTEDLPSLVSPAGIEDLEVTDIVDSVNDATDDLKTEGADVVVMLVHEGAPSVACATMNTGGGAWADIVNGVSDDVDAIVSGHTHLEYNCSFPVAGWSGRPVTERPVVSAGQYGANLNQLVFTVDTATGDVVAQTQKVLKLKTAVVNGSTTTYTDNYPTDAATKQIVDAAVAEADVLGAQKLGELGDPFNRAKLANGTTENRGGESTLGNLVAEVQRWATRNPESGSAQIAFMNPGGLRQDMTGTGTGAFPRDLTYKQAAVVQPFANTLVNMDLTGAQIEKVLEQQWQRDANNKVPSRPFLRLGISDGFTYTYTQKTVTETPTNGDPAYSALRGEITGMWLDGEPIDPAETYSVTVNSFLASGGDNFRELGNGAGKQDTGKVDLAAMVDYLAAAEGPLAADFTQRSVGVTFPNDAPESYAPGAEVAFTASSLAFASATDTKDANVTVYLGSTALRTTGVTNTIGTDPTDEYGTAPVTFVVPAGTPAGPTVFRLVGNQTGTEVPVTVEVGQESAISAGDDLSVTWGQAASIPVEVTGNGDVTGTVRLYEGETPIGAAVTLSDGAATLPVPAKSLEPGAHTLRVDYVGNLPDASDEVVVTVAKATTTVVADDVTLTFGDAATVTVTLGDDTATGSVEVRNGSTVLGTGVVSGGVASVNLPAGSLEPGVSDLTAAYAGDGHFLAGTDAFTATVAKAASTVSAGDVSLVYGKAGTVTVTVSPSTAGGTVQLFAGSTKIGAATAVSGGSAKVTLPARSLKPGSNALRAEYSGDSRVAAGSDTFTVSVAKAASSTKVTASPATAKVKKTRVVLKITVVGASGVPETGKVRVVVPGQGTKTLTLRNGKATLTLAKFTTTGRKTIRVSYLGSDLLKPSADTVQVVVRK